MIIIQAFQAICFFTLCIGKVVDGVGMEIGMLERLCIYFRSN